MAEKLPPIKTDKKGEFTLSATKKKPGFPDPRALVSNIDLTASLVSPKNTTIEGTLTFNGNKFAFKAKTGEKKTFKKLKLEDENKIKLEGSTDPVQAETPLVFEVDYS